MLGYLLAPLRDTLRPHFNLSKTRLATTRLATMAIILFGLANSRTVSLSHLASQFPGKALHASNYRRLQHFFKQVQFDEAVVARFIVSLLNIKGPVILAVDRTNWKLGKVDINILVLAIVTRRFKVPLIGNYMRKCASGGQSLANAERGVSMCGFAGKIDTEFFITNVLLCIIIGNPGPNILVAHFRM